MKKKYDIAVTSKNREKGQLILDYFSRSLGSLMREKVKIKKNEIEDNKTLRCYRVVTKKDTWGADEKLVIVDYAHAIIDEKFSLDLNSWQAGKSDLCVLVSWGDNLKPQYKKVLKQDRLVLEKKLQRIYFSDSLAF